MKKLQKITQMKLLILLLMIWSLDSIAQEPAWKLNLDKEIEWTRYTPNKILLVGTADWGLHGVDAKSGKLLWSNADLYNSAKTLKGPDGKKLGYQESLIRIIQDPAHPEYADFGIVKYADETGVYKNFVVINLRTGVVVISPKLAGMPVTKMLGKEIPTFNYYGSDYIPDLGGIIISANWIDYTEKGAPAKQLIKLIDLTTGKVAWESNEAASEFLPLTVEDGNILVVGNQSTSKLDAKTGKTMWTFGVEDKKNTFEAFDANIRLTEGYVYQKKGSNGIISAVDLKTGSKLWEKPYSTKDAPQMNAEDFGVIVADEKNFTLFDAKTGNIKWTAKKLDGVVVDLGENYGIAVGEKGKYLTVLDKNTGEEKWSQKIKGIQIDQLTGNGIMYRDENGSIGIFGRDGNPIWDGKEMIKGEVILRTKPNLFEEYFYADEKIYKVDLATSTKTVIQDKVELKEKESPDNFESFEDILSLSSSQNMYGLSTSGAILYQDYWASPKISLAGRIALRTLQVAMIAGSAANGYSEGYSRGISGGENSVSKQYGRQREMFEDMAGAFGESANKRFKASKSRGIYNFILTDLGGGVGIVRVDKISGKETGKIVLNDKEPIFDTDPENGMIFYKPSRKEVYGYIF
jgi:outer membrane protein assembly factor BamB